MKTKKEQKGKKQKTKIQTKEKKRRKNTERWLSVRASFNLHVLIE